MKLRSCLAWTVLTLALSFVSSAQAQKVTFSSVNDAVPKKYFDSATTAADPNNSNRLILGLNTGLDPVTFVYRSFIASTAAYYRTTAMDTIRFRVSAPSGYYLSRITYTQRGAGSTSRTGRASGGTQWVVNGTSADIGLFRTSHTLTGTVDLTGQKLTTISVSITTSLFAFATSSSGSANLSVSSADVLAEVVPRP